MAKKRIRIYSHITQSSFLHIEDSLNIGKLRLFAGTYRKGQGSKALTYHFVDTSAARTICHNLIQRNPTFTYKEYKGAVTKTNHGQQIISRTLSIKVKQERIFVELTCGPGKLTKTGAIAPNGRVETAVTIPFDWFTIQSMAHETLAFLRAWDIYRLWHQQKAVSVYQPYELVSSGSQLNGVKEGSFKRK